MKLNKPGFWDYKKPNFIAYILLPLTFFVLVGNFFTKKFSKKKMIKLKQSVLEIFTLAAQVKLHYQLKLIIY
ncbi:MAG: hypothetical protein ACJZ4I_02630 [Candidatus Pelagibacter sp.]